MAYGGPSRVKDNFNRFQKQATINIKKQLKKDAEELQVDVEQVIAEELLKKYKENVRASYSPRSSGSYTHTGTFLENIGVVIENDPGIGRDRVKIVLKDKAYPPTLVYDKNTKTYKERVVTTKDVYEFLTEGTEGGGYYSFKSGDGKYHPAYNYPTPAHLFEQHTQWQMRGFLETLDLSDYTKNKKYRRKK